MGDLLLVRHGQAGADFADYDMLSPVGVRQAGRLGAHLSVRSGDSGTADPIHAVYSGPRRRQRETATHLLAAARAQGATWAEVEPVLVDELDEFPFQEVLRQALVDLPTDSASIVGERGGFSTRFAEAILAWADGRLQGDFERYPAFVERVGRGVRRILEAEGRGRRILLVTSGGPIAVVLARALQLTAPVMLRQQAVIANASISHFKYRKDQLTLLGFNAIQHLDQVTFR